MAYADWQAKIQAKRDGEAKAREKRDEDEMDQHVGPIMLGRSDVDYLHVPLAAAHLPGHIVLRLPKPAEIKMVRFHMWRDAKEAGAVEAKAKAGIQLAAQCLVYPSPEKYTELTETYASVGDEAGKKAFLMAGAGADADAKH